MEAGSDGVSAGDSPATQPTDESPSGEDDNNALLQAIKAVEAAEVTIERQAEENSRLRSELQKKIQELENYREGVSNIRVQKGLGNNTVAYDQLEGGANGYGVRDEQQHQIGDSVELKTKVLDAEAGKGSDQVEAPEKGGLRTKVVILEWFFVVANALTELLSAVLEQLSSTRKPHFALMGVLLSFTGVCLCVIEVIHRCIHEKVFWKWRSRVPWFYHPSGKLFGTFRDVIGLVCALCQCIITSINYEFYRRHADAPVKVSLWPLVFALGLLCSRFLKSSVEPSHTD